MKVGSWLSFINPFRGFFKIKISFADFLHQTIHRLNHNIVRGIQVPVTLLPITVCHLKKVLNICFVAYIRINAKDTEFITNTPIIISHQ